MTVASVTRVRKQPLINRSTGRTLAAVSQLLRQTLQAIRPADESVRAEVRARLDRKTKPIGALGRLEDLAVSLAVARQDPAPSVARKVIVVAGADHGCAGAGVSAYPREVTAQMMLNFAAGGAAINVIGESVGADVRVLDVGVLGDWERPEAIDDRRIRPGTANLAEGPAMTRDNALAAIETGIRFAQELAGEGYDVVGLGDMGIGNTTPSSAITAVLTGLDVEAVTGRGTGVDDDGLRRKVAVIKSALDRGAALQDPVDVLAEVGGLEIGALAGIALGAAAERMLIVCDGFITTAALALAHGLNPSCVDHAVAAHRSVEVGHAALHELIGLNPYLDLTLRLGEGTGGALLMPLLDAAVAVLERMATFESAGVSEKEV